MLVDTPHAVEKPGLKHATLGIQDRQDPSNLSWIC
jgi:hypothetical protein